MLKRILIISFACLSIYFAVQALNSSEWVEQSGWRTNEISSLDTKYTVLDPSEAGVSCEEYKEGTAHYNPSNMECKDGMLYYHESYSESCSTSEGNELYVERMCEASYAGKVGAAGLIAGSCCLVPIVLSSLLRRGGSNEILSFIIKILSLLPGPIMLASVVAWQALLPDNITSSTSSDAGVMLFGNGMTWAIWAGVCGLMVAVAPLLVSLLSLLKDDDDDDDDDEDHAEEEDFEEPISTFSTIRKTSGPSFDTQGERRDDGYEWLEHPQGSNEWYWRDVGAGQWVKY
jgi:hypothetical protein